VAEIFSATFKFFKMTYFKLEYPVNNEEVGKISTQINHIKVNSSPALYDIDFSKIFYGDFKPPTFILDSLAKLTDFVSSVPLGNNRNVLLISNKAKDTLLHFDIESYTIFDAYIFDGSKTHQFNMFHLDMNSSDDDYVDFNKTLFVYNSGKYGEIDESPRKFKNIEDKIATIKYDYFEAGRKFGIYRLKSFVLKTDSIDKDIFHLNNVCPGTFVSERVKRLIEMKKLTGIRFIPIENIVETI
jgi:hypothetical protein